MKKTVWFGGFLVVVMLCRVCAAGPAQEFNLAPGVSLKMQKFEGGTFEMGSRHQEVGRDPAEMPHQVTIRDDFYIGVYEVTQEQFSAVMKMNPSKNKGDKLPVTNITWQDAMEFCKLLNQRSDLRRPDGYEFSLPTEAQWEYACRAGTATALNNGKNLLQKHKPDAALDEVAWYKFNTPNVMPHPVGEKRPNARGLYDMHGNVWEMCLDNSFPYRQLVQTDPLSLSDNGLYCLRGGSFLTQPWYCRSAFRNQCHNIQREPDFGFRVALVKTDFLRRAVDNIHLPSAPEKITNPTFWVRLSDKHKIKMCMIRPSRFWMGSPEKEKGRQQDEVLHEVHMTYYFYIGKYEITEDEYQLVMGNKEKVLALPEPKKQNVSSRKKKKVNLKTLPRSRKTEKAQSQVSWDEAMEFCDRLNKNTGLPRPRGYIFSLPTEAEWEYACRAGSEFPLYGERILSDYNLDRISNRNTGEPLYLRVGLYKDNLWGLHDPIGNVAEWCLDSYAPYSTEILNDPLCQIPGAPKVYRGGWVGGDMNNCRAAARFSSPGGKPPLHPIGFRIVLVPMRSYIERGGRRFPSKLPKNFNIKTPQKSRNH